MSKTPPKLPGRTRGRVRPATTPPSAMFGDLADNGRLRTVTLDAIRANPRQPRRIFDEDRLTALATSIAERGILQPPVVRALDDEPDVYELVAGERRCRAARIAGLASIEVLVKDTDDAGQLEDAVLENTAREDLSPVEEARAYSTMVEDLGMTREAIGRRVGQSRASISNHLRLLDLPDEVLDLLDTRRLTFAHGRVLLLSDDHDTRRDLARRSVAEGWSTRRLEVEARRSGAPRVKRPAGTVPADRQDLADRLSGVLDSIVRDDRLAVRATAHDTYTITVKGSDLAQSLIDRLQEGGPFRAER